MERNSVYRCEHCGNIVEVLHSAGVPLHCCGQPMTRLTENTTDAATEKHVPAVEQVDGGYVVKVGSVSHPMEEQHYVEWIELIADGTFYRKFLNPGDPPEARFELKADQVTAKAYCNLHGFWKS